LTKRKIEKCSIKSGLSFFGSNPLYKFALFDLHDVEDVTAVI